MMDRGRGDVNEERGTGPTAILRDATLPASELTTKKRLLPYMDKLVFIEIALAEVMETWLRVGVCRLIVLGVVGMLIIQDASLLTTPRLQTELKHSSFTSPIEIGV